MDDKPSLDEALMHFGVKGMKWGQRKKDPKAPKKKKIGIIENTALNMEAQKKFNDEKLAKLVDTARKGQTDVLIKAYMNGDTYGTDNTGREFVAKLERGAYLNIGLTEVYARKGKNPNDPDEDAYLYEPREDRIGQYKWKNFNKQ